MLTSGATISFSRRKLVPTVLISTLQLLSLQ